MTSNSKKYRYLLEQQGDAWKAQIIRQVSSKKTVVSKEQAGFESEAAAKEWAEAALQEFASTLNKSNQRHGEQRKVSQEVKRQRSNRRADKTQKAKDEALRDLQDDSDD